MKTRKNNIFGPPKKTTRQKDNLGIDGRIMGHITYISKR
jgi:hypothetical protein